ATKSGQVPVNANKQSSPRAATSISTTRPVNAAAPKSKVNDALPTTYSYFKAHSLMFVSADGIKSFLLIMFLLVMFLFLLTEIESADLIYRRD
ncbi:hypothetical protein Tco_0916357, partial [Tanacetum coccineum]